MAPIAVQFDVVQEGSPLVVALGVASVVAVLLSIALTILMCACGKKKPQENPPTDQPPPKEPETPSEPVPEAAPPEPMEPSAKTAFEPPQASASTPSTSMMANRAPGFQLMSTVEGKSYAAGAAKGVGARNQPSLVLLDQSAVQRGKQAWAPGSQGPKSVSTNPSPGPSAGGKSVTVNQTTSSGKPEGLSTLAATAKSFEPSGTPTKLSATKASKATRKTEAKSTKPSTKASSAASEADAKSTSSMRGAGSGAGSINPDLNTSASGAITGLEKTGIENRSRLVKSFKGRKSLSVGS